MESKVAIARLVGHPGREGAGRPGVARSSPCSPPCTTSLLRGAAAGAALFLAALLAPFPARAQIVRGQVLESGSNAPVEGAMVVLLEPSGQVARRVLTDRAGGFILRTERVGSYLIRVDRIGYESLTTEPFAVPQEGVFRRIIVPIQPVQLEGLEVGGSRRCALRGEQGEATARVWEEARKALEAAAWTLSSGSYRYTLLNFERELDRDRRPLRERRTFQRATGQAPYVSYPAALLVEEGFVVENPDRSLTYRAPDAASFLSDEFLDTHCMSIESVKDGLIGLDFQPVRGRRISDIQGTLWIEAGTATLRKLTFHYTNLPLGPDHGGAGGEVVFGRLPNGTWIVREWSIRMPRVSVSPDRTRISVTGYLVQGGVVWRVSDRDGNTVLEAETASVSGTVVDSLEAGPVEGALVRSADEAGAAMSGGAGSFFIPGLPPGLVTLEVTHPYLDSLRLGPVVARTQAPAGEVASVRVRLPGVAELLAEACSDAPPPDREGAPVLGLVTQDGRPAEGATVRVRWMGTNLDELGVSARSAPPLPDAPVSTWRPDPEDGRWIETQLDRRGIFLVCAVPARTQLLVQAAAGDDADAATVAVPSGARVVLVPLRLRPRGEP